MDHKKAIVAVTADKKADVWCVVVRAGDPIPHAQTIKDGSGAMATSKIEVRPGQEQELVLGSLT